MGVERGVWPRGRGGMAMLIRQHDWASTALGHIARWRDGLRTAVGIMLDTRHPAALTWGEELVFLYNDGCAALLGPDKHPRILGLAAPEAWPESHHIVSEEIRQVMEDGGSIWHENRMLPIHRNGAVEDAWWTYSRSPVHDARAKRGVGGVLTIITETTRPVLAQRDSEARFQALFEQSPLMVHVFDANGRTLAVNPAFERSTGVTAAGMRNYNIFEDPHYQSGPARTLVTSAFSGEAAQRPPLRHKMEPSSGGSGPWVESTSYPVKDEAGHIREVVILSQDVTAKVEAETALNDAEARFRIAREAAKLGIFDYDFTTGACIWDKRIRGLWGVPQDEAISDAVFMNGVHPDDRALVADALASAAAPGGTGEYRAEYRVINRETGATCWLAAAGRAFFADGEPVRLVGTVQDISERRRYEDALRTSEERLQIGLSAAQLGHWNWNAATDQVQFSERACAIFGVSPNEELTWKHLQSLLHPDDVQRAVKAVKSSLTTGEDYSIEYRIVRKDGTRIWATALGRPVYGKEGMPPGMTGVIQDITESKRAEEKIRLLMAEVNHRSKNLLAVVQSIAHQTSARGTPRAFAHRFSERLQGLAASHDLLVGNAWQGVELYDLVESQLAHFRDLVRQRIRFHGPGLQLRPAAAQALGMALHELATNAAKYGSLSASSGHVAIHWNVSEENALQCFRMEWRETGGPRVEGPVVSGFGSKLISHMTEIALQGRAVLDFPPEGAVWTLEAPLDRITPDAADDAAWRELQG